MMRRLLKIGVLVVIVIVAIGIIRRVNNRDTVTTPVVVTTPDQPAPAPASYTTGSGEYKRILTAGTPDRRYLVHVPPSYNKNSPMPVVLFFHGGGGNMNQAAEAYGWRETSDANGFIVVFLNGTSRLPNQNLATWNAGTCCGYARDKNIDDIGYVRNVITSVEKEFNIDTNAIFATGFSNGGMMIHRLACDAPELVRKVVAVSGTKNTLTCTPKTHIPLMHIHALDDTHLLFNGGAGEDAFRDSSKISDFVSVPDTKDFWVKEYRLSPAPERIYTNDSAYCDRYGGASALTFTLCVTPDGKHSWPGSVAPSRSDAIPSKTLNGNEVIWKFFMGTF